MPGNLALIFPGQKLWTWFIYVDGEINQGTDNTCDPWHVLDLLGQAKESRCYNFSVVYFAFPLKKKHKAAGNQQGQSQTIFFFS